MAEASLVKLHAGLDLTDDQSAFIQVMAGANVDPDLCRHMVSLGHNELKGLVFFPSTPVYVTLLVCLKNCVLDHLIG